MPRLISKSKPLLLYTLGDPAGIGPEILVKALTKKKNLNSALHVVIGDKNILNKSKKLISSKLKFNTIREFNFKNFKYGRLNIIDLGHAGNIKLGCASKISGRISLDYLKKAINILKKHNQKVKAVITLPVSKKYIEQAGVKFRGHTEYLRDKFKAKVVVMIFLTSKFDLLLLTRHLPLKEVVRNIKEKELIKVISIVWEYYRNNFGLEPKIAVLGINPHAGEDGKLGREEEEIIIPAINKLKRKAIKIDGPYPADGFFRNLEKIKHRVVVSMYHDQVLPLIKALFKDAVNFTLGLPFLRFSPNHGTAFDIAGQGIADSSSLEKAIEYALRFKCR